MADNERATLDFDELHILDDGSEGRAILSHDEWFGAMKGLTDRQRKDRIRFAQEWEDEVIAILILLKLYDEYGMKIDDLKARMLREVRSLVEKVVTVNSEIIEYLEDYVRRFFEVTFRHLQDPYYTSDDRARDNGNQEASTIYNRKEYEEAKANGAKFKTWHTMLDDRVRDSHTEMEGETIQMDDLFLVGPSMSEMRFPRDWSHGASPEEIINCRCWLTYSR